MSKLVPRHDILICCEDLDLKLAPRTAEALLRHVAITRVGRPVAESIAETWAEIYMEPAASAHEPFMTGARPDDAESIFFEAVIRLGTKPVAMPFGAKNRKVTFFFEIRGCLYDDIQGPFRKKFNDICKTRCVVFSRKHKQLTAHRKVPKAELPKDKARKSTRAGGAGTRVEEF